MRIPHNKIYRAFPELDVFTDRQCELYLRRVRNISGQAAGLKLIPLAVGVVVGIVSLGIALRFHNDLRRAMIETISRRHAEILLDGFWIVFIVGGAAMAALVTRDLVLRFCLARAIRMRIERIRCFECKYSLLGQRVTGDRVTCPECGHGMTLAALGVGSADELLPTTDTDDEFCPRCGGDLGFGVDFCRGCGWREQSRRAG